MSARDILRLLHFAVAAGFEIKKGKHCMSYESQTWFREVQTTQVKPFFFNMFIVAKFVKSVVNVKYKSWNLIDAK